MAGRGREESAEGKYAEGGREGGNAGEEEGWREKEPDPTPAELREARANESPEKSAPGERQRDRETERERERVGEGEREAGRHGGRAMYVKSLPAPLCP